MTGDSLARSRPRHEVRARGAQWPAGSRPRHSFPHRSHLPSLASFLRACFRTYMLRLSSLRVLSSFGYSSLLSARRQPAQGAVWRVSGLDPWRPKHWSSRGDGSGPPPPAQPSSPPLKTSPHQPTPLLRALRFKTSPASPAHPPSFSPRQLSSFTCASCATNAIRSSSPEVGMRSWYHR